RTRALRRRRDPRRHPPRGRSGLARGAGRRRTRARAGCPRTARPARGARAGRLARVALAASRQRRDAVSRPPPLELDARPGLSGRDVGAVHRAFHDPETASARRVRTRLAPPAVVLDGDPELPAAMLDREADRAALAAVAVLDRVVARLRDREHRV